MKQKELPSQSYIDGERKSMLECRKQLEEMNVKIITSGRLLAKSKKFMLKCNYKSLKSTLAHMNWLDTQEILLRGEQKRAK